MNDFVTVKPPLSPTYLPLSANTYFHLNWELKKPLDHNRRAAEDEEGSVGERSDNYSYGRRDRRESERGRQYNAQ